MPKRAKAAKIIFIVIFICVIVAALTAIWWTDTTMVRLEILKLGEPKKTVTQGINLEVHDINGNIIYRQDYTYSEKLSEGDNITIPQNITNIMHSQSKQLNSEKKSFQEVLFTKLRKIDPLDDYIINYYTEELMKNSDYKGTKKDILRMETKEYLKNKYSREELYSYFFDTAYFSDEVQGFAAASKVFFNKQVSDLSLLEATYLTLRATYDTDNLSFYETMARSYLYDMYKENYVEYASFAKNFSAPLKFSDKQEDDVSPLVANIIKELTDSGVDIGRDPVKVSSHYNPRATEIAYKYMNEIFEKDPKLQGAFVMLNAQTGGIEVLIGGRDNASFYNRGQNAVRPVASTFKPVVFALSLEQGMLPSELVNDKQYTFGDYSPRNWGGRFRGNVPLRLGLVHSINNTSVYLAGKAGLKNVVKTAQDMGFDNELRPYYAMALGSFGTSPLNLAEVYMTLANFGVHKKAQFIDSIDTGSYNVKIKSEENTALSAATAYQIMYILQATATSGTGRSSKLLPGSAIKTGTSNLTRDAWSAVICYPYIIVVWFGYDDNKSINIAPSGGAISGPVIGKFQREYFGENHVFEIPVPQGIVFARVNSQTGLLADDNGSNTYIEAFKEGHLPKSLPKK